jgi:hypothetical protein
MSSLHHDLGDEGLKTGAACGRGGSGRRGQIVSLQIMCPPKVYEIGVKGGGVKLSVSIVCFHCLVHCVCVRVCVYVYEYV